MKLFYTRKEVEEAIHNALVKEIREHEEIQRFNGIERRLCDLEIRLANCENRLSPPEKRCGSDLKTCDCTVTHNG